VTSAAFIIRALLSGLIVAAIAMLAKRSPALGGLLASIPLVSTLGMIWLWRDTQDTKLVADYVGSTFWYFLPSMPMFLVIPALLRHGFGFWASLAAGCALTVILYLFTISITARFGIRL
jgi:hypothetical protein